jgi:molybdate-binding protein
MAGVHLLDEEAVNITILISNIFLPGIPVAVVHLADRIQGFMVPKATPRRFLHRKI